MLSVKSVVKLILETLATTSDPKMRAARKEVATWKYKIALLAAQTMTSPVDYEWVARRWGSVENAAELLWQPLFE